MSDLLSAGEIRLVGQLADASNTTLLVEVRSGEQAGLAVYKPVSGERPLWDFPDGTLAGREVAAYLISEAGGWGLVPPTVLRDGPLGPGSVQEWVGDPAQPRRLVVTVTAPDEVAAGWLAVLQAESPEGDPLVVAHEGADDVRAVSVFDAAVNNADRKGSHLMRHEGRLHGFDHGLCLHEEDKLRTILWGWAGEPLSPADRERLTRLAQALAGPLVGALLELVTDREVTALRRRVAALLETNRHPEPTGAWPAVPWPAL